MVLMSPGETMPTVLFKLFPCFVHLFSLSKPEECLQQYEEPSLRKYFTILASCDVTQYFVFSLIQVLLLLFLRNFVKTKTKQKREHRYIIPKEIIFSSVCAQFVISDFVVHIQFCFSPLGSPYFILLFSISSKPRGCDGVRVCLLSYLSTHCQDQKPCRYYINCKI